MPWIFHRLTYSVPPPAVSMVIPQLDARTVLELQRLIQCNVCSDVYSGQTLLFSLCALYNHPKKKENNNSSQKKTTTTKQAWWRLYARPHSVQRAVYPRVLEYQNKARAVSWSVLSVELNFRITSPIYSRRADGGAKNKIMGNVVDITTSLGCWFYLEQRHEGRKGVTASTRNS